MKVVWARAARDDRHRITAWMAECNKAAAVRIARALAAAADSLAARPAKGRPGRAPDTRELSAVPPYGRQANPVPAGGARGRRAAGGCAAELPGRREGRPAQRPVTRFRRCATERGDEPR